MGLRDYTIYDFIRRNAVLYADQEAIVYKDVRLTHREFKQKCDSLAAGLLRAGVGPGDRLGVVAHNCDEFVILYGAAAKIGTIVVPVNWRFSADEVAYVLKDVTPMFVFAGPDYRDQVLALQSETDIEKYYTIGGGDAPAGYEPFSALYDDAGAADEIDITTDTGFVIIHTAAVEGRPRGALLSQGNICAIDFQRIASEGFGPESCHICLLPLFHIAGLARLMAVMHAGGKNVIFERFDPGQVLKGIEAEKGTTFFNFSPILERLIEKHRELGGRIDLSSLRTVGGLDQSENLDQFGRIAPNVSFGAGFGQTEAMAVTWAPYSERPGSAGKPTIIAQVALFDDDDQPVAVGGEGEICVRGPSVFLGYWNRVADTAHTFRSNWHHTGDIGRFDADGYLWYVKRKPEKELIKPGGENVYPAEVEGVIMEHPDISEVSVIGVPDRQWGEAVLAVCVAQPGKTIGEKDLIDFVASRIARYKKPHSVVFVDALPKTGKGGIDRDQVKNEHGGKY